MNRILIALFATVLLCGNLLAQSQQPPDNTPNNNGSMPPETQVPSNGQAAPASSSTPTNASTASANAAPRIAPGSVIPVQLTKSIDAKKAKTGDEVVAKVTGDLRNNAGTVIVPKDTKVIGHVTEAQARNKEQKESELAIAFDHMVPKNGEPMQIPMSIQAIIAPQNPNSANASGGQQSAQPTSTDTGGASTGSGRPGMGGTSGGTTGGTTSQTASVPPSSGAPAPGPTANQAQQPITGNTRGVVGIANLNLAAAPDAAQGSVVSSEKNNVKLEDGILLLLRVN
jgi:hypothetical protein